MTLGRPSSGPTSGEPTNHVPAQMECLTCGRYRNARSHSTSSFAEAFVAPFDAQLFVTPRGGSAGALTEFGIARSQTDLMPLLTGLPNNPTHYRNRDRTLSCR